MKQPIRIFFLLAVVTTLAACGKSDSGTSLVDVAQAATRQADRVSVQELAGWLIEARGDIALVDVRSKADFDKGHIKEARHIPIAEIVSEATLAELPDDRKILVYSNGSENASKAATLLRVAGLNAHVLTGGYNAWQQNVLNPDIPEAEFDGENLQAVEQRTYACYFAGNRDQAAERPKIEFKPPVFKAEDDDEVVVLKSDGRESC